MHRPAGADARAPVGALVLLLAGCGGGMQSPLDPAGPYARSIATHYWAMAIVGTLVLLVVAAAFVASIWHAPQRRPAHEPPIASEDDDPAVRAKTRAVILGATATVMILVGVLVHSVVVAADTAARDSALAAEIEVIGHQWWWEMRYLDPDPSRIVVSANELHLPTGRPVRVRLRSSDVIHSFWVPNLQGKIDMIPGHENTVRLFADRAGTWRAQCAEFCGMQHAKMAFAVVAHTPEEFERWRARERRPAAPPATPLARRGAAVFTGAQCAYCHAVRGTAAAGQVGPDLTHFGSRLTVAAGAAPNTRGHVGGWIADPDGLKPGTRMPPTPLEGPDLNALLAYLESLR